MQRVAALEKRLLAMDSETDVAGFMTELELDRERTFVSVQCSCRRQLVTSGHI